MKTSLKRLLPLLLVLTLPGAVRAQLTYTTNNSTFYYMPTSTNVTITGYVCIGNGGEVVTIPSSINGLPVTGIGDNAFSYCTYLGSVAIPNSVTSIGDRAFAGTSLISVTIPNSVTTIGDSAFAGCTSLGSFGGTVTIGTNVISIGDSTFYSTKLSTIIVPNSVTSIGTNAFGSCYSLTNVTIGSGVINIGDNAFNGCTSLTTIIVNSNNPAYSSAAEVLFNRSQTTLIQYPPGGAGGSYIISNTVTTIGATAFQYCNSLTNVTIGTNVASIGDWAFSGCGLTNATIYSGVTNIGKGAFSLCYGLTTISVNIGNPSYSSVAGVLFNKAQTLLVQYPIGNTITGYTIPSTVTSIGAHAFDECDSLTSVAIGTNVNNIGDYAFYYCSGIGSITIPDSVTNVGNYAFTACTGIGRLTIGKGLISIGTNAFYSCWFGSVTIPYSVTSIGDEAFGFNPYLQGVYFLGNAPSTSSTLFSSYPFQGSDGVTVYYVPETSGWGLPFGGMPLGLWDPQIQCVYVITNGAVTITGFNGPGGVVNIPNSVNGLPVTCIGDGAFNNFFELASIRIPDGVTAIGNSAFANCYSLTNVTIPNSITSIGNSAFESCFGLAGVTIPDSIISIGSNTFQGCSSLNKVTLGANIASIGSNAFQNCSSLTSITIPHSVTSIAGGAFAYCYSLVSVIFQGNPPGSDSSVFTSDPAMAYYQAGTAGWGSSFCNLPTTKYYPVMFTGSPTNGSVPLAVNFSSPGVDTVGNVITSWKWKFGDGGNNIAQSPTHIYTSLGTFSPTLAATNSLGAVVFGFGPASVTVTNSNLLFTANPTRGLFPLTVSFTSPAIDSLGKAIANWNWDFGDGSTSTLQNPSHTYNTTVGTFFPRLIANNSNGIAVIGQGPQIAVTNLSIQFFTSLPTGTNGISYSQQLSANFGHPPFGWSIMAGSLPSGLTLTTNGFISGTPTFAGTTSFTLKVTDALSTTATDTLTLTVLLRILHDFAQGGEIDPNGGLLLSGNALYGETFGPISGAIFRVNADGTGFTNLYNFSGSDGPGPIGGLALSGNNLYGATVSGGAFGNGSLFKVNTDGTDFTNLYNFTPYNYSVNSDGFRPLGGLLLSSNILYGTAQDGGSGARGTVFKINTDGTGFVNLHSFSYNGTEGMYPNGGLIISGNTLYGTAELGGSSGDGVVFAINTDGTDFTNLYSFTALSALSPEGTNSDGASPQGGLILSGGILYSTTRNGGGWGAGTVFAVNTDGTGFRNLHSFTGGDGDQPFAGLVLSGNTLYGTTSDGGSGGVGTLFAVNTDGTDFRNLYSFTTDNYDSASGGHTNSDGAFPYAGLILSANTLYGTAQNGGSLDAGTVFAFSVEQASIFNIPYTASPTTGTVPLTVQFTCPSVDSGGNTITRWNWNFGDGTTSTSQSPSHVYASAGTFQPSLVATNSLGVTVSGSGPAITAALSIALRLSSTGLTTNGGFQLSVYGQIGQAYTLQASTNLVNWVSILGFTCTNSPMYVVDPAARNFSHRFYRVAQGTLLIPASPVVVGFGLPHPWTTNGLALMLQGPVGSNYMVQASTNLLTWLPITNFVSTNSPFYFSDPLATNYSRRFYRAIEQ
jgi:uncharacterized repeat protein (TIGR03803 family)